jgi:hypothetical protein
MNCKCGQPSYLSPLDYVAEANDARMVCAHCGRAIHFGPAVAALRDRDDAALIDNAINSLAWYHTSTSADWPSANFATRFANELSWIDRDFGITRERYIAKHTTKALHVGTYETAVENMLRRMDDQGDGRSDFYLYRVALSVDPGRINHGYRDENHEIAADISVSELDGDNLDAVRYLNVHEAMGTLSLAVRPTAIAAVQSIRIPIDGLAVTVDSSALRKSTDAVHSAMTELLKSKSAAAALDPRNLRMMQLGARPDPTGLAKRLGKSENQLSDSWRQLKQELEELCLPNVSVAIRRDFNDAIGHWRREGSDESVLDFISRYRSMAALLENPTEVIRAFDGRPWRIVNGAG